MATVTSRGRYVKATPRSSVDLKGTLPEIPGYRLPGTLYCKPFDGSTKAKNPHEAPLGVYLLALAQPAISLRGKHRRKRPVAKVVKPVRQPRRTFAEIGRDGRAREVRRRADITRAVLKAFGAPPAGWSGGPLCANTKANRLRIREQVPEFSLAVIQDYLAAQGEA